MTTATKCLHAPICGNWAMTGFDQCAPCYSHRFKSRKTCPCRGRKESK